MFAESLRSLQKKGLTVSEDPPVKTREVTVGQHGPSPRTIQVPEGIDPGWSYNVGEAAWGRSPGNKILAKHGGGKWKDLPGFSPADFGRPTIVPTDVARAVMGDQAKKLSDVRTLLKKGIGGDQVVFADPRGDSIAVGQEIADHMIQMQKRLDGRERFFPFIKEIVEEPYEVWANFAQNEETGQVGLRKRYVKQISIDKDRTFGLVGEAVNGHWVGVTFFRGRPGSVNNLRKGVLAWGRKE